jgi:hypothetical protein
MYTPRTAHRRLIRQALTGIFFIVVTSLQLQSSPIGLLIGKIVSPLSRALTYEISYEGQKVTTEVDGSALVFRLPTSKNQWRFFLLFIEDFDYVFKESSAEMQQNTVDYQRARANIPYHIFEIQRHGETWTVVERLLPHDGRIPDSTIIVKCPADYLKSIEGGTYYQLPTIALKDNIVELAGSEKHLRDKSAELHIASLELAAFQAPMRETIHLAGNRILLVPTA